MKWTGDRNRSELAQSYQLAFEEALELDRMKREPIGTESIAVGSQSFISAVSRQLVHRPRLLTKEVEHGLSIVRESSVP